MTSMNAPVVIDDFRGEYACFSNFSYGDVEMPDPDGRMRSYPTTEHAFQAAKTLRSHERAWIAASETPSIAKRRGRDVDLRPDWESVKYNVMYDLVKQKFTKHEDLQKVLLSTENHRLVEGNTWHDNIWGSCRCLRCKDAGTNWLGKILMKVRAELRGQ